MNLKLPLTYKAITALMAVMAFFLLFGCFPKPEKKVAEKPQVMPIEDVASVLFEQAEQAFYYGNYEIALMKYQLYLDQKPMGEKARDALYRMAVIFYQTHRYIEALDFFKRIINEYPTDPEVFKVKYDVIKTQYELGDYQSSIFGAFQWIDVYSDNPLKGKVLLILGKNFVALNDKSKAFVWLIKALENLKDNPTLMEEADNIILKLIENGNIEDLKVMAEYPLDNIYKPNIYYQMASYYLDEEYLDEAKNMAMELVRSTTEQEWVDRGRHILEKISIHYTKKKFVVGCLFPLSGPFAIYGQEALNGIQLGMDLFKERDQDTKLELIIWDTQGKAEVAVQGVEDLVNNHDVTVIIGPLASKPAEAAAQRAQELGIPIITLTQKRGITHTGDMVFRNFLTPSKEIDALLHETIYRMGMKRYGILYPNNPYGTFFMNLFWDRIDDMGGIITAVESYNPDETDFKSQIKKMTGLFYPRPASVVRMLREIKIAENGHTEGLPKPYEHSERISLITVDEYLQSTSLSELLKKEKDEREDKNKESKEPIIDFDAVFIPDNFQKIALIAPQFPFHSVFNVPLLGTSLWQSQELIETAGDYIQGAIFPTGFFPESDNQSLSDFIEKYRKNFELEPGIIAASGYDTIMFLKKIFSTQIMWSRKEFHQNLFQSEITGITGKISFDTQGEVEKEPILLSISGRRFHSALEPKSGNIN